jgi:hypothetical protein
MLGSNSQIDVNVLKLLFDILGRHSLKLHNIDNMQ